MPKLVSTRSTASSLAAGPSGSLAQASEIGPRHQLPVHLADDPPDIRADVRIPELLQHLARLVPAREDLAGLGRFQPAVESIQSSRSISAASRCVTPGRLGLLGLRPHGILAVDLCPVDRRSLALSRTPVWPCFSPLWYSKGSA